MPVERDRERLAAWLERFGRAWELRDAGHVAELFAADGSYREAPFDEPIVGADAIAAYWSTLPAARDDIEFESEVIGVTGAEGIAHWNGAYTRADDGVHVELDGVLVVMLDDDGRCREFREWSIRRELPGPK